MVGKNVGNIPCVVVFTCRGKARMLSEGGSQAWRIDASRASKYKYVVCVQNRNETWGQASAPHKEAFLIAEISQIQPSKDTPDRQMISFSSYADISVPDKWDGNRNPVAYMRLSDFGINTEEDLEDIPFCRLGARIRLDGPRVAPEMPGDDYQAAAAVSDQPVLEVRDEEELELTIGQAKQGLAKRFGVSMDQIEIIIRA